MYNKLECLQNLGPIIHVTIFESEIVFIKCFYFDNNSYYALDVIGRTPNSLMSDSVVYDVRYVFT